MTFLPIVSRELRVQARRISAFWLRAGLMLVALLICWFMSQVYFIGRAQPTGQPLFRSLVLLGELLALGGGLWAADSLSRERREGTLGLLMLTDLKGYDVLLGKAASLGLGLGLAVLGLIPCLCLPLLMGGVRGVEVVQACVAIGVALVYSLSLGLWIASRTPGSHQAMRKAGVLLAAWSVLPLLVLVLPNYPWAPWFTAFSPAFPYGWMCFSPSLQTSMFPAYVSSLALLAVFSIGYLWMADRHLRANWQALETPAAARGVRSVPARYRWFAARLDRQPITWLVDRQPAHRRPFFWAAGLGLLSFLFPFLVRWITGGYFGIAQHLIFSLAIAAVIAWGACRYLVEARASGEMELLLVTPVGAQSFLDGYWRAVWKWARWAFLFLVVGETIQYLITLFSAWRGTPMARWFYCSVLFIAPVSRLFQMLALCSVAMRLGVSAQRPATAVAGTLALVVCSSWLLSAITNVVIRWFVHDFSDLTSIFLLLVFLHLPVIAKDIFLWRWAQRGLRRPGFLAKP